MTTKRFFKIINPDGSYHGKYFGKTPKQAANKALSKIIDLKTIQGENIEFPIKFCLKENNSDSQYNYTGTRTELENPHPVKIGNKEILVKYKNDIKLESVNKNKESPKIRKFKILDNGVLSGRYKGWSAKQAATKAFTSLIKNKKKNGEQFDQSIKFTIVESTRGSNNKQYNYIGELVELKKPVKIQFGNGTTIVHKYKNNIVRDTD